jgi:hypothetical protein
MITNEIELLNEIAKQLILANQISLTLNKNNIPYREVKQLTKEVEVNKDKITAVSEKPIDVWKNKRSEILNYPPPENRKID